MGIKITLNAGALDNLDKAVLRTAELTIEALKTDVVAAQVMPFNVGDMQNINTFTTVQQDGDIVRWTLVTGNDDSPQARRLYFHPEYNFQKINNHNAGGEWLEPWINGEKKEFIAETFEELLKKEAKL